MSGESSETGRGLSRIEGFSDAVFSVAITLLVLDLKVPDLDDVSAPALWQALLRSWPAYVALLASFIQVLIMWVNHHGIMRHMRGVDPSFTFANGFLLLLVILVPFPTALVSAYLTTPAANVACAVYAGTYVLINIAYNLLWYAATRGRRLLRPHVDEAAVRRIRNRYLAGFPAYLCAVGLAFVRPWMSLALCAGLYVLWLRMGAVHHEAITRTTPS